MFLPVCTDTLAQIIQFLLTALYGRDMEAFFKLKSTWLSEFVATPIALSTAVKLS